MAKVAVIADTHAGVRNDASVFNDMAQKFYETVFFPEIDKRGIKRIIHLGDITDRRKYINYGSANRLRNSFFRPMNDRRIHLDLILGNHDIYWRDDITVSCATEMLWGWSSNFRWYEQPTEVDVEGRKILFVPWICYSNRDNTTRMIEQTDARVCFGHLELQGFQMYRNVESIHGENPSNYSKFSLVCSGHFHHRSRTGNVHYLGSHGQFNWADHGDERGFHIFDTDTLELEFIRNPYDMFLKVHYNDNEDCLDLDYSEFKDKFVKVIVRNRNKQALYDTFLSRIDEAGAAEYTIVDDHLNAHKLDDDFIVNEARGTLELMKEYVATIGKDTEKVVALLTDLYKEAHHNE